MIYLEPCSAERKQDLQDYYTQGETDGVFCQTREENGEVECKVLNNALCVDDTDLFLQGDVLFSHSFAGLTFDFESCHDNPDLTDEEKESACASKQEIDDYMASMILFMNIDF